MQMIKRAHWNILTECNLSCGFCYLWRRREARVWQTAEALKLVDALSTRVEELVFGGGDPLMRDDLIELIIRAKNAGLTVELHTNAELLDSIDGEFLFSLLDRLGLSLDGEDEVTHDSMRSANGNFSKCMAALALAESTGLPTTVRTLCTRRNSGRLQGISKILSSYSCVEKWSIRQFVPLGRGAKTQRAYWLDDKAFNAEVVAILTSLNGNSLHYKIGVVSENDMADCFCLITEDGVFYGHPIDRVYRSLGKFPEEPLDAILSRLFYLKHNRGPLHA